MSIGVFCLLLIPFLCCFLLVVKCWILLHSEDLAMLIIIIIVLVRLSIRPAFTMLHMGLGTPRLAFCDGTPPFSAQYPQCGHTSSPISPVTSGFPLIWFNLHLSIAYLDCSSFLPLVIPVVCIIGL